MVECFLVFSEVIAFVCVSLQFAAVRTLLPLHRTLGADAGAARANEVGKASIARFAPPMSHRGTSESRELSGPLQKPEWWFDGRPKCLLSLDSDSRAAAQAGCGQPPLTCGTGEPPQCWNARHTYRPAVTEPGQVTGSPEAGLVDASRLLAGLVFHQVRSRDRSAIGSKASRNRTPGPASTPGPDAGSVNMLGPERSLKMSPSTLWDPPLTPIETLLVELARRRLRSLAAKKRPR